MAGFAQSHTALAEGNRQAQCLLVAINPLDYDTAEATIVGRPGAFASQVKARQDWAIPLPEGLDPAAVGHIALQFCGA